MQAEAAPIQQETAPEADKEAAPTTVDLAGEVAKLEGLVKSSNLSNIVEGQSADLKLVTLEECEVTIQWSAAAGWKIISTKPAG